MAENAGGFMGGLSEGLQQGTNMGYLRMQAQAMMQNQAMQQQQMAMAQQKAQQEQEQQQQKMMMEKAGVLNGLFTKEKDPKIKAQLWKSLAPMYNQIAGTNFSPDAYSPVTSSVLSALQDEYKLFQDGKIPYEKFMSKAGMLTAMADDEERKALKDSETFFKASDPERNALLKSKVAGGNTSRLATIMAQAYDDAWREEKATNMNINFGIEEIDKMPEVRARVEARTLEIAKARMGQEGLPAPNPGAPPPAQDKIGEYLKSINAKDTPANRKWAQGQIGG